MTEDPRNGKPEARRATWMGRHAPFTALSLLLAIGVGLLDLLLPLGAAIDSLFVVVIVVSLLADDARVTIALAVLSTVLIVIGALLSPSSEVPLPIVIINRSLFIIAVWVTVALVLYRLRATQLIRDQQQQLEYANLELARQARSDSLTGVANRRAFDEQLQRECTRANRANTPLSLAMIDVDHFKPYNDTAGHPAGDDCLKSVAVAIQTVVRRPIDFVARYGGEEFAVILPATALAGACERAEEIRRAVHALAIPHPGLEPGKRLTVSVGVGSGQHPITVETLVRLSDEALYRAKHSGRDRVVCQDQVARDG